MDRAEGLLWPCPVCGHRGVERRRLLEQLAIAVFECGLVCDVMMINRDLCDERMIEVSMMNTEPVLQV